MLKTFKQFRYPLITPRLYKDDIQKGISVLKSGQITMSKLTVNLLSPKLRVLSPVSVKSALPMLSPPPIADVSISTVLASFKVSTILLFGSS